MRISYAATAAAIALAAAASAPLIKLLEEAPRLAYSEACRQALRAFSAVVVQAPDCMTTCRAQAEALARALPFCRFDPDRMCLRICRAHSRAKA